MPSLRIWNYRDFILKPWSKWQFLLLSRENWCHLCSLTTEYWFSFCEVYTYLSSMGANLQPWWLRGEKNYNGKAHRLPGLVTIRCSRLLDVLFFEKVAVRAGSFKPKWFVIDCINQDPVGFHVAVAGWLHRSRQRMVSVVWWKWGALSSKLHDFPKFLQIFTSFPHSFDLPGKLSGLGDLLHFSQSLDIASNDSNSW